MQQISENVYVETGYRGANVGLVVVEGGVVLIDTPQQPSNTIAWREFVLSKGKPLYIVHTEAHGDHIIGDFFFPEAVIVAQEGMRGRFPTTPEAVQAIKDRLVPIDPEGMPLLDDYVSPLPTITFSDRMHLYVGSHTFDLVNLPGHTAEETAVVIPEERVAFTGDNIFCRCQAYIQEGSPWQWLESLKKIAELDVDVLVPGHGAVCDRGYVPEMAGFVQEWIDVVQSAVDRGLSLDESMATISMLDRYPVEHNNVPQGPAIQQMNVRNIYERIVSGRR